MSYENMFSQFADLNKSFYNPMIESAKLFTEFSERFTRQQLGMANSIVGTHVESFLQDAAHIKKAEDAVALNSKVVRQQASSYLEYAQQTTDLVSDFFAKAGKLFEKNLAHAAEHHQAFAAKATAATKAPAKG